MKYVMVLAVVAFLCLTYGTGDNSETWGIPNGIVLRNATIYASRHIGRYVRRNFTYVGVSIWIVH